jgi:hypothetical protein
MIIVSLGVSRADASRKRFRFDRVELGPRNRAAVEQLLRLVDLSRPSCTY